MEEGLPPDVAGHRLRTEPGDTRRLVTHYVHDPSLGPFAAPRAEQWKRQRRPIGRGGQGDVYIQERVDSPATQLRAVKMICCTGDMGKQRYVRELQTMVRFSHDQYAALFVRMLGWYLIEDYVCIAMEYLPEGDLHTYLNNRPPLPESDCKQVISQVVRGIDMMHHANLAHRDIKPQNILIKQCPTTEGEGGWWIKLADFGIAKRIDTTETVAGIGTQEYMAPELQGVPGLNAGGQIDRKAADIWAIGIMSFVMQTKTRGFLIQRRDYTDSESVVAHYKMSSHAADFLLKATSWIPLSRPDSGGLMTHPWIEEFVPQRPQLKAQPDNASLHSTSSNESDSDGSADIETNLASAVWDTEITENAMKDLASSSMHQKPHDSRLSDPTPGVETPARSVSTTDATATWDTTVIPQKTEVPQHQEFQSGDTTRMAATNVVAASDVPDTATVSVGAPLSDTADLRRALLPQKEAKDPPDEHSQTSDHVANPTAVVPEPSMVPQPPQVTEAESHLPPEGTPVSTMFKNLENELMFQRYHRSDSPWQIPSPVRDSGRNTSHSPGEAEPPPLSHTATGTLGRRTNQSPQDLSHLISVGDVEGVRRHVLSSRLVYFSDLHVAARQGHSEIVNIIAPKLVLSGGVSQPDENGWTALHHAAAMGHALVVRNLVEKFSADLTAITHDGDEASFLAVRSRDIKTIWVFIKHNRPLDNPAQGQFRALRFAVESGDVDLVKYLLNSTARYTIVDDIDMVAAIRGNVDIVLALVLSGVGFSRQDPDSGDTALHLAAHHGHTELARLLNRGLDLDISNSKGLTALDIACQKGHLGIVRDLVMRIVANYLAKEERHLSELIFWVTFPQAPLESALKHAVSSRKNRVVELILNLQTAFYLQQIPRPSLMYESKPYDPRLGTDLHMFNREALRSFPRRRHLDWIGIVGPASDLKVFALTHSFPAMGTRLAWVLHNGSDAGDRPLITGGVLSPDCGLGPTCLDTVLHMSTVQGQHKEDPQAPGGTVVLRARIATARRLAFRFSRPILCQRSLSSGVHEEGMETKMWEWRQKYGSTCKYELVECSSDSTSESAEDVQPLDAGQTFIYPQLYEHQPSGSPIAFLELKEKLMAPTSFDFIFVDEVKNTEIAILAIGTAIQIWHLAMSGGLAKVDPDRLSLLWQKQ